MPHIMPKEPTLKTQRMLIEVLRECLQKANIWRYIRPTEGIRKDPSEGPQKVTQKAHIMPTYNPLQGPVKAHIRSKKGPQNTHRRPRQYPQKPHRRSTEDHKKVPQNVPARATEALTEAPHKVPQKAP